jgi:hypothetical protein
MVSTQSNWVGRYLSLQPWCSTSSPHSTVIRLPPSSLGQFRGPVTLFPYLVSGFTTGIEDEDCGFSRGCGRIGGDGDNGTSERAAAYGLYT